MGKDQISKTVRKDDCLIMKGISDVYYDKKVVINFMPEIQEYIPERPLMQRDVKSIIPKFNKDQLYYTPSFILPWQQVDTQTYLNKHYGKVQKYSQINQQQILVPKPRNRSYCHVCEDQFDDYRQHINSTKHSSAQKNSKYFKKIQKLCKRFRKIYQISDRNEQKTKSKTSQNLYNLKPLQNHILNAK